MPNDELRAVYSASATARRRPGLGRGLDAVIAGAEEESPPAHVQPFPGSDLRLSIAEGVTGTTVTVADGRGRSASVDSDWSSEGLRDAAIRAVASLAGVSVADLFVSTTAMGGVAILTVLIQAADGARHVGAAAVAGTETFAAVEAAVAAVGVSER